MITFEEFKKVMSFDARGRFCIEIMFSVNSSEKFNGCWMGKMPDEKRETDVYWYGLTADGENAYDYSNFDEMVSAKVFDGKSLPDIWDNIEFLEIDGCEPYERFASYINGNGPFLGAAK